VDQIAEVRRLEVREGAGTILMHGFGPVAQSMIGAGLLDALHNWYHPSFVGAGGEGDRLHTDGLAAHFQHVGTRTLSSGVVVLSYAAL
jgi:dihydrofolate reductase